MNSRFCFVHAFVDDQGGYDGWGAVAVADFDGDGRPEFATGGKGGGFYHLYDLDPQLGRWSRHVITRAFSPNVGAAADLDGDGRCEIVCGEWGERLFWLVPRKAGQMDDWHCHVVAGGLVNPHDVLAADIDGDGRLEIFTGEMENNKSDGVKARPKWWCLSRETSGTWTPHILLDANLGTHSAAVADFDGDGRLDIVGKVWRANKINGNNGRNHVDFLRNVGPA